MYLLDTNVLSELRRPERADPLVRAWAARTAAADLWLSAITILEIEQGVLLVERRDRRQGAELRRWLEGRVLGLFEDRILAIDAAVARRCARLHVPDPQNERDALIAATALVHGFTVVTRNVADFGRMEVVLLDPWSNGQA
jgi:predicted nucleic acid-binding protein